MRNNFCLTGLLMASFAFPAAASDDLMPIKVNSHVHFFTSRDQVGGHQPLCEGIIVESWPDAITVRLINRQSVCGQKDQLIHIVKEKIRAVVPAKVLTKGRLAARIVLGGVLLTATVVPFVALESSGLGWLLILTPAGAAAGFLPAAGVLGAWKVVPGRSDFNIAMECSDATRCF